MSTVSKLETAHAEFIFYPLTPKQTPRRARAVVLLAGKWISDELERVAIEALIRIEAIDQQEE